MANRSSFHRKRPATPFDRGRSDSAERGEEVGLGDALRRELAKLLERRTNSEGRNETAMPELQFYRYSQPTESANILMEPAVYVVVQGRKQVTVGDETYIYDRSQYLAVSVDLPAVGRVFEASPEEPYLCMTLTVDPRDLAALIVETGRQAPRDDHDGRALYVSALRVPLLDGFLRLVRLLDAPHDISVLAPLILRELHYRLLQSEQFGRLAQIAIGDGRLRRVSGAIAWIKAALRGTAPDRGAREAGQHEPFGAASLLQGGRRNESGPVPEATAAAGGSAPPSFRSDERGSGCL